jgi:hypothetical protein
MEASGQLHASRLFTPKETAQRYSIYRRLGRLQSQSEYYEKFLTSAGK